jgi:hypothetical protein
MKRGKSKHGVQLAHFSRSVTTISFIELRYEKTYSILVGFESLVQNRG